MAAAVAVASGSSSGSNSTAETHLSFGDELGDPSVTHLAGDRERRQAWEAAATGRQQHQHHHQEKQWRQQHKKKEKTKKKKNLATICNSDENHHDLKITQLFEDASRPWRRHPGEKEILSGQRNSRLTSEHDEATRNERQTDRQTDTHTDRHRHAP
jgi:hypothetical protein